MALHQLWQESRAPVPALLRRVCGSVRGQGPSEKAGGLEVIDEKWIPGETALSMGPIVSVFIPGQPKPKGRPRKGKNGHMYTPRATIEAEQVVGWKAKCAMKGLPVIGAHVSVRLRFVGAHGLSDTDNLVKLVLDACNGVIWKDDRQVRSVNARKVQMNPGGRPSTLLEVYAGAVRW